jgi:excinuclease ABC subunit C
LAAPETAALKTARLRFAQKTTLIIAKFLPGKFKKIPKKPGVYLFKDISGRIIYIGKAIDLRKRVQSHFRTPSFFNASQSPLKIRGGAKNIIADIDWIKTDNEKQALILENELIKKYKPRYNIQWKDDKSYFWITFSNDEWPRVQVVHRNKFKVDGIGPFFNGRELRQTLRVLRKILPFRTCKNPYNKPCLQWHLGLCAAHGLGYHSGENRNPGSKSGSLVPPSPRLWRAGKPGMTIQIDIYLQSLKILSRFLRLYAGEPIRIEAYDVSNIQGKYATGSMVVFYGDKPQKSDYRRFRIKTVQGANDIAMIKEVLRRRLGHPEWPYPDLILIDGGRAQLDAAQRATYEFWRMAKKQKSSEPLASDQTPYAIMALAKKEEEIYTEYNQKPLKIKQLPDALRLIFQHIRDEAHRFAIFYYRYLHEQQEFNRIRKHRKTN